MNTRVSVILGVVAALSIGMASASWAIDIKKPGEKKAPVAKPKAAAADADDDSVTTSDDGKQFALTGDGKTVTHDCKGGQAVISGNKNKATLKNCATTSLNGDFNIVSVTGLETMAISGNDNVVNWVRKIGGDEPDVADAGERNKVSGK
jgi:hypothetical protein